MFFILTNISQNLKNSGKGKFESNTQLIYYLSKGHAQYIE